MALKVPLAASRGMSIQRKGMPGDPCRTLKGLVVFTSGAGVSEWLLATVGLALGLQNKECLACKEMHCPALWLHSYSPQLLGFRLGSLTQATPVLWRKSLALLVHHQGVVLTMKLGKSQSSHRKNRCED